MTRKEWLTLSLIVAWLMGVALNAAVPTTFVTGSLNLPSGSNPSNVTITLTPSQSFSVTDAGGLKYQVLAPVTYSVTNSGVLAMYVVPNTGANNYPDWTTYTAEVKSSGRVVATQTWQLASSTLPVTVANIITASTVTVTPTNALPLSGGQMLGKISLATSSTLAGLRWAPTAAPSSAEEGDTYINSVDGRLYIRFGGAWVTATDAAVVHYSDLTGNGTAASPLRITPGSAGAVLLTNTAGTSATMVVPSGDVTISSTGVTSINAAKVTNAMLHPNIAITGTQLSPSAGITGSQIASVPNTITNLSGNQKVSPAGNALEVVTGKYLLLTGQAGPPAGMANGGVYNDTTRGALMFQTGGVTQTISGVTYRMIASSVTLTNPTGNVTIPFPAGDLGATGTVTPTIPANTAVVGQRYHVHICGQVSAGTNASQSVQVRLFWNGHSCLGVSTAFARLSSKTNRAWNIDGDIIIRSTTSQRASGFSVVGNTDDPSIAAPDAGQVAANSISLGHNMAQDTKLEVIASFGVADAANAITMTDFILSKD